MMQHMKKKSKKDSKAEPANKKRFLMKLQKQNAFSEESAKSLKEIGITDLKKFERHIEVLESEGKIKRTGTPNNYRYWASKSKLAPKKKSGSSSFLMIWFVTTFVLLFVFVLIL